MPNRRVLVAHPDETVREQLVSHLSGLEVVTVAGVDQLVQTADDTFHGMIIACCFGDEDGDGLSLAALYRHGRQGSFNGFVLGLGCSGPHQHCFQGHGMTSSSDALFIARVMKHEMVQLC